jgi:glyoxylase-like metal-dependent hydrolase (beta-lactamase superfamily II)
MEVRVISIGALSAHPLWNEKGPVRVGHATTTLIRADKALILVDPSLPEATLAARLRERANVQPSDVTHVFLTSFRPDTHRGITACDRAEWLIHQDEREGVGQALVLQLKKLAEGEMSADDRRIRESLEQDVAILQRCKVVAESIVERVDIFPMPGVTPGMCGLLIEEPRHTTVICGDAIPTVEHLEQGKVLVHAVDVDRAKASFEEAVEIADLLVLGRDNMVVNPTKRPF